MSEVTEQEESAEVRAARGIGAASRNSDWMFAAKHWHRVTDDDPAKQELLRLGVAAVTKSNGGEIYSGYSSKMVAGSWYKSGTLIGQIASVSLDGKRAAMIWYNSPNFSNFYTTGIYTPADLVTFTKLDKRPF